MSKDRRSSKSSLDSFSSLLEGSQGLASFVSASQASALNPASNHHLNDIGLKPVFEQVKLLTSDSIDKLRKHHPANNVWLGFAVGCAIVVSCIAIPIEIDTVNGISEPGYAGGGWGVKEAESSSDDDDSMLTDEQAKKALTANLQERLGFVVLDCIIQTVFVVEMCLKLGLHKWGYFADPWNLLDYHLVIAGLADLLVTFFATSNAAGIKVLRVFRMLRMLRGAKSLRYLHQYREVWTVVSSFLEAVSTVFWVLLLLLPAIYAISCLLVMMIGSDFDAQFRWEESDQFVGSTARGFITVYQLIMRDRWSSTIVRPIASDTDGAGNTFLALLLTLLVLVVGYGFLNITIGLAVQKTKDVERENESEVSVIMSECETRIIASMRTDFINYCKSPAGKMALTQGKKLNRNGLKAGAGPGGGPGKGGYNNKSKKKDDDDDTISTFSDDSDDPNYSPEVTFEQFCQALRTNQFRQKLRLINLPLEDAEELFFLLDVDQSGTLSVDEFVCGLPRIRGCAQGSDVLQLLSYVQRSVNQATELQESADGIITQLNTLMRQIDDLNESTQNEVNSQEFHKSRRTELHYLVNKRQRALNKIDRSMSIREMMCRQPQRKENGQQQNKKGQNGNGHGNTNGRLEQRLDLLDDSEDKLFDAEHGLSNPGHGDSNSNLGGNSNPFNQSLNWSIDNSDQNLDMITKMTSNLNQETGMMNKKKPTKNKGNESAQEWAGKISGWSSEEDISLSPEEKEKRRQRKEELQKQQQQQQNSKNKNNNMPDILQNEQSNMTFSPGMSISGGPSMDHNQNYINSTDNNVQADQNDIDDNSPLGVQIGQNLGAGLSNLVKKTAPIGEAMKNLVSDVTNVKNFQMVSGSGGSDGHGSTLSSLTKGMTKDL